jgi:fructosamine-3-kinase
MKVVSRKDFEEKWRSKMAEFFKEQAIKTQHEDATPHHNGGNAKLDEVLEKVGLMMRKVMNIETLIKNPLATLAI